MTDQSLNKPLTSEQPFNGVLWGLLILAFAALGYLYYDGLDLMVKWWDRDEYSHGYMIPMVAAYLIWQRQHMLPSAVERGSWFGVILLIFGLFGLVLGELSAVYTIIQYSFLLSLYAIFAAFFGWRAVSLIWAALVYLVFMIPLPNFIYNNLSSQLQLISSSLGVFVVRLFDISVYLEGNVIDLGQFKLQVVEACSGLRYLFPLASFGFLIAYLYHGPFWQRAVLFLSTIPITVFMNSFRIGVIGVTVEYWGIEMAEGFLHDFEGWVIFMGCLGVLLLEIWVFHLLAKDNTKLLDRIDVNGPEHTVSLKDFNLSYSRQKPFIVCLLFLIVAMALMPVLNQRTPFAPDRESFSDFPLYHKTWQGREFALEQNVLDTLKLTDYIQANYQNRETGMIANFYMAYYQSQIKGASIHSPRSCIPGGGWQVSNFREVELADVTNMSGQPLRVNRAEIRKDEALQIVYYWFEQRGRNITNEYLAKWYLFWDSLAMNRTDGALVRVIIGVDDASKIDEAEQQAQQFIRDFYGLLPAYLPGSQTN